MWAVASVLLGIVLFASLVGFHAGPHHHVGAAGIGVVAAVWLLAMALAARSTPVLWALLGADFAVSAGIGVAAWKGLKALHETPMIQPTRLEGQFGIAETALEPDGLVRVRGESWSATSRNGNLPTGARVQVIQASGVRLEVWGEDVIAPHRDPFVIDDVLQANEAPSGDTPERQRRGS